MKKHLRTVSKVFSVLIVGVVLLLVLFRSHPVVFRTSRCRVPGPNHVLFNPFRDKAPEATATAYLARLKSGDVSAVACCVGESTYVLEKEREFPITSWRLGDRKDSADGSRLTYWVYRGNGYPQHYESDVLFMLSKVGNEWQLRSFSAVY